MKSKEKFRQTATLTLLRNSSAGLQVYMTERPGTQDFPGLHVFPGGKVDAQDHQLEYLCSGPEDDEASALLNLARGGLVYWVTAIRESFEEAGLLLTYSKATSQLTCNTENYQQQRLALRDGDITLQDFCLQPPLTLATNKLHYFSHWITPETAPRRYDARFFVCDMPEAQQLLHDTSEVVSAEWISPGAALDCFKRKCLGLVDPTDELRVQGMQIVPQFTKIL